MVFLGRVPRWRGFTVDENLAICISRWLIETTFASTFYPMLAKSPLKSLACSSLASNLLIIFCNMSSTRAILPPPWNLDALTDQQVSIMVHRMLMYSSTCRHTNNNSYHATCKMIIAGFKSPLQGWWDNFLSPEERYAITNAYKLKDKKRNIHWWRWKTSRKYNLSKDWGCSLYPSPHNFGTF